MAIDYTKADGSESKPRLNAKGLKFGIIVSRFNSAITTRLLDSALEQLITLGTDRADITVTEVPGAFELPQAASILLRNGSYNAIICLGCVIRGETSHYEYICQSCANGLVTLSIQTGVPMIFGVLTTENTQQADERSGGKNSTGAHGHKGRDSAQTAVEMALLANKQSKYPIKSQSAKI